jgi:hypothetical protein
MPDGQGPGLAKAQFRAFRITSIPASVNWKELHECLEALVPNPAPDETNVQALTLAPHGRGKIATIVFRQEPPVFAECTPGSAVDAGLDPGGAPCRLSLDCDFFGMTPLYDAGDDALVEYDVSCSHIPKGADLLQYRCCYGVGGTCFWILEVTGRIHNVVEGPPAARSSSE